MTIPPAPVHRLVGKIFVADAIRYLPTMADQSVDVVITDPPYGLNFKYHSYCDTRENLRDLISATFSHMRRIARKRVVILCGPTQIHEYPTPDWIGIATWNTTGSFGKYGYSQWTPILLYGKDRKGFGSIDGVLKSDRIALSGGGGVGFQRDPIEKEHTCPKPMTIMDAVVNRYADRGDVILDPFLGSGSTGVAALNAGNGFIGFDIDRSYVDISYRRMNLPNAKDQRPATVDSNLQQAPDGGSGASTLLGCG